MIQLFHELASWDISSILKSCLVFPHGLLILPLTYKLLFKATTSTTDILLQTGAERDVIMIQGSPSCSVLFGTNSKWKRSLSGLRRPWSTTKQHCVPVCQCHAGNDLPEISMPPGMPTPCRLTGIALGSTAPTLRLQFEECDGRGLRDVSRHSINSCQKRDLTSYALGFWIPHVRCVFWIVFDSIWISMSQQTNSH